MLCTHKKMLFKPSTQDFPFQINQDQIPKHFISAFQFPNQPKQQSDLGERVSSLLFYSDLSGHPAREAWGQGQKQGK